jgi:hypothetical protein
VRLLAIVVGLGLAVGVAGGATYAAFFATSSNTGNSFAAVADWTPPSASASVIARTTSYLAGLIRQGGSYYVYANISDSGNPASGVTSVTANVSNITTGQTAVALSAGSFSVNGVGYGYRSAALTANNPLVAGAKTYTLTMTDGAGNSQTQSGFNVTVDNTAPTGSDVQTANGGATVGKAETGDRITYTYSQQIDPYSILANWTGASVLVTVRINNNSGGDRVQIWNAANTAQLRLGLVILGRTDYVTGNRTFTNSAMVQTGTTITVTLGTPSGATGTAAGNGTMTWTPNAAALDAAGNACSTAVVTESGLADREF